MTIAWLEKKKKKTLFGSLRLRANPINKFLWKLIRPLIFYLCFVWFFYRVQGILLGVSHSCCEPWLWAFRFIFLIGKSYVVYGIYVGFGPI